MYDSYLPTFWMHALRIIFKRTRRSDLAHKHPEPQAALTLTRYLTHSCRHTAGHYLGKFQKSPDSHDQHKLSLPSHSPLPPLVCPRRVCRAKLQATRRRIIKNNKASNRQANKLVRFSFLLRSEGGRRRHCQGAHGGD